ncbi:MAG: hypothetical protein ACOVRN_13290 [Flavobacterium sp.]
MNLASNTNKESANVDLELQLGDVIRITNPTNENLHLQTFIIDYIAATKAYLINTETMNRIKIKISEDGTFGDGHIRQIELLCRADSPSYARQNGLLPGKWVNIYFGGDYPVILTGQITNLEEDMIELKTIDKDVLYINFDYKGIPEELPIDIIEIREKPTTPIQEQTQEELVLEQEQEEGPEEEMPELAREPDVVPLEQIQVSVPIKDVKNQLREMIIRADQIVFGDEELGPLVNMVDVSAKFQRYSIETQVTDLLDDLLSTVPNAQRTPRVLNNIHIMIERFKQLRSFFSNFDQYGNVESMRMKDASYKPLKNWLEHFHMNLMWILPVVKNVKKVYNVENDTEEDSNDLVYLNIEEDVNNMKDLLNVYRSNNESNKYTTLYSDIAPYFRPFQYINDETNGRILIEKEVEANLSVVIDNLEDFYSSVFQNNNIRNRRFVIGKYNLADTKLDITETTSAKMTAVRVKLASNDLLSVKSILTLPEPTIRFSAISLPGTDILSRANLNQAYLNYWQLLKQKSIVSDIFVENLDTEFDYDANDFVNGIRNYVMNIPDDQLRGVTQADLYKQFINTIVPKSRVIFNLMKKYIKGRLSIVDVVSYLEPFLIYVDDITYDLYVDISEFIDARISEYNKQLIEFSRIFKMLGTIKQVPPIQTKAFALLTLIGSELNEDVFESGYQLEHPEQTFTGSEILRKMVVKDYANLYTSAIAYENLKLAIPKDVNDIFEEEKKVNNEAIRNETDNDTCKPMVIAKLYQSLEQMERDNDVVVYFDKRYDKTNYGIMEEAKGYAEQVMTYPIDKLKEYITKDQMKRNNLSEVDAEYMAETLIDGNKKVIDGQYAIVYKGYTGNYAEESDYYVRKDHKWVLDKNVPKEIGISDESTIACDLQEKCMSMPTKSGDKCESTKTSELTLQNTLLTNIISEFDTKYKQSKQQFEEEIKTKFEYFMSIMPVLAKIETSAMLKYNNQQYKMGIQVDDESEHTVSSPFAQLLDLILGQQDFVKKQSDIVKFADKFTRPGVVGLTPSGKPETSHWLYCIKTNAPLLPAFKKELAVAFIVSPFVYQSTLEKIKSTNGQLSDDGDWWTDKYTGWPICPGEFDTEEGYEEGFKVSTRAIMEEDAGNKIMAATAEKTIKYVTPETVAINNIVNALSVAMGIHIEHQKEFIINGVIDTIKSTVENERDYKERVKASAQKGKTIQSYRDLFNTSMLYYTLGMYLIAVQTSIPSVRTRKTHPGCVRSFTGYPFDGAGDYSSLIYLACIAYDIRSSSEPWNVLKKTGVDKIQARIQTSIDQYLIQLPEVQRKFTEKTEYLLTNPASDIPKEHDISKWSDFLPPLVPFKMRHLVNISDEFKRALLSDLRSGSEKQRERLLVIESKIIQFSLAIQEKIQDIVRKHRVLLHTANNEPYLENACCDSSEAETTVQYFTNRDKDIVEYNQIVERLSNILDDVHSNTEANLLYSKINTKNIYPSIATRFNEKTVYMAFIFYCKFKSLLPVPNDLLTVCVDKPDAQLIDASDTIDRIIQKLKEDGRNYTNDQFLQLIKLVSRENIIQIELNNPVIDNITQMAGLVETILDGDNDEEMIEKSLCTLIADVSKSYKGPTLEYTDKSKNLNNFLRTHTDQMVAELTTFIEQNGGARTTRNVVRKCVNAIDRMKIWDSDVPLQRSSIASDSTYTIMRFYKTFVNNFISIFPTIILNKVNYDEVCIPSYYGFSRSHTSKLSNSISSYYEKLVPFYGMDKLNNILYTIQQQGKSMMELAEITLCDSSIQTNDGEMLRGFMDETTCKLLGLFYVLRILIAYIALTDRDDMCVVAIPRRVNRDMDLVSSDYAEERITRVNFIEDDDEPNRNVLVGNKRELREKTAELLIAFMAIFAREKDMIDVSYQEVQDRVFKLKEREKNMMTDKLKGMSDELREADTMLKITKQGTYSKGLEKGLTSYDKEFYDRNDERELREEMEKVERLVRKRNRDATDENIDILVDEYLEQRQVEADIDAEAYDMGHLNENYYDGNYDGVDAPEMEYNDYETEY